MHSSMIVVVRRRKQMEKQAGQLMFNQDRYLQWLQLISPSQLWTCFEACLLRGLLACVLVGNVLQGLEAKPGQPAALCCALLQ